MNFKNYKIHGLYDELLTPRLQARSSAGRLLKYLKSLSNEEINKRKQAADLAIKTMGITFTVYSEGENIDREWPYDIIPRIIPSREWRRIEKGLQQRMLAINHFIDDIYNEQKIIKDKIIPRELLKSSKNYRKECRGMKPVFGAWAHICGSDLIRDKDGTMYVLEDNLRVPSGVSYMLENRKVTKRVFPELFEDYNIVPLSDYPTNLFDTLSSISPRPLDYPEVVVLTPGIFNSAYFEHSFLAQQMGAELVEGSDLVVADDDCVYMKTIEGLSRVDVIYRRIDDLFLDPEVFNKDSALGVPGLMRAWKKGNVALANAPGAGVADDKVVYTYVPDMIKYYLDQDPIIPNVPSYSCDNEKELKHVLANIGNLVVKPANESGGYGMLVGPHSTKKEQKDMAALVKANPRNYIAQPVISLSTVPTLCDNAIEPRHVDLRPFTLQSDNTYVTAGGLTRVALVKGSLVVNSSQGGGSKDTWVISPDKD
ncbi:MAG: circularly permuted type 2 ATP-grasp protein [Proteobacteria bacterium]|nr:circularly permuted type 2 ATP-grasp protein [Pseudomonadota bacterium]NOG59281.1 circularly permuted type 2 ATP-grasp protein [Pseudomonadota bacterium]